MYLFMCKANPRFHSLHIISMHYVKLTGTGTERNTHAFGSKSSMSVGGYAARGISTVTFFAQASLGPVCAALTSQPHHQVGRYNRTHICASESFWQFGSMYS